MSESPTKILNKTLYVLVRELGLTPQEVTQLRLSDLHLVGKNPYLTLKMGEDGPVKKVELDLEAHRSLVGWLVARPDSISDLLFVNTEAEGLTPLEVEQAIDAVELEETNVEPQMPPEPPEPLGPPEAPAAMPPTAPPEEGPERNYVVRDRKPDASRPIPPVRPAHIKPPSFAPEGGGPPLGTRPVGPVPPVPPPAAPPEAEEGRTSPVPRPPFSAPSRPVRPVREQPPGPPAGQKSTPVPPVGRRDLGYTPRAVSPQKVRTPPPPVRKPDKEPAPELMPQDVALTPPPLAEEPVQPVPEVKQQPESEPSPVKAAPPPEKVTPEAQPAQAAGVSEAEAPAPSLAETVVGLKKPPELSTPLQPDLGTATVVGLKKPAGTEKSAEPAADRVVGLKKPAEAERPAGPATRAEPGPARRGRLAIFGAGGIALMLLVCAACITGLGYLALQTETGTTVAANLGLVGGEAEETEVAEATETALAEEVAAATPVSPVSTPTLPPTSTPTSPPPTDTPASTETPTPTVMVVDTATATPVPTDTPLPTDTPTPEPPPATPTPAATATPEVEPTPGLKYGAPVLLEPEDGFDFIGGNTIVLRWQPVGELASDEQYAVRVRYRYNNEVTYQGANIKETEWTFPLSLYNRIDPPENRYEWFVVVERLNEDGSGTAISPESEHRTFTWK